MNLRELKQKDAKFMLEWMRDKDVVENMQTDFSQKTLLDCENFIANSQYDIANLHLAIVNDMDTYMGTVSLKNIAEGEAEFAIALRKCAMGKGYSQYGMREIFRKGLEEFQLKRIYWCVSPDNKRAVRFYDKNGCERVSIDQLDFRGGIQRNNVGAIFGIKKSAEFSKRSIKQGKMQFHMFYPCFCK